MRRPPLALALLVACQSSSSPAPESGRPVERFPSFPAEAVAGEVVAEARFYVNHASLFGADLPRESKVLPIALRVGITAGSPAKVRFAPEDASTHIVLADGTVLPLVPASSITTWNRNSSARAVAAAARSALLVEWSVTEDGFVYFALQPEEELHVRGDEILHKRGDVVRKLDLDRSLVVFDVEVDGERRQMRVGVKLDTRSKKR